MKQEIQLTDRQQYAIKRLTIFMKRHLHLITHFIFYNEETGVRTMYYIYEHQALLITVDPDSPKIRVQMFYNTTFDDSGIDPILRFSYEKSNLRYISL